MLIGVSDDPKPSTRKAYIYAQVPVVVLIRGEASSIGGGVVLRHCEETIVVF